MPTVTKVKRPWIKEAPKKEVVSQGRAKPNQHIYNDWEWKKYTTRFGKDNPFCEECKRHGKLTDASPRSAQEVRAGVKVRGVTDHIVPINQGVDPWDRDNHQRLCTRCHNSKNAKEGKR